MTFFLQQLVNGLSLGSLYGLMCIGYALIYNTWGVLNFSQGDMVMIGAFALYTCGTLLGLPIIPAILLAIVICGVIGYLVEIAAFRPLINASNQRRLIATIGVGIFLRNTVQQFYGADAFAFPTIFGDKAFNVGGVFLVPQNLWNMFIAIALVVILMVFLKTTRIGKAMRATAQDREAARLMGINVKRCMSLTFVMASILGGIAGILLAPVYQLIASMGETYGNKAFAAALFGGMTSNSGSIIGGLALGVLECMAAGYGNATWQNAVAFLVLFLVLVIKPTGITGKKEIRKV